MKPKETDTPSSVDESHATPMQPRKDSWRDLLDLVYRDQPRAPNATPPDEKREGSIPKRR